MKVSDVMVYDISAVFEDETVERVVDIMSKQLVSGVPVVDEDMRVVGFITENDIMKASIPSYFALLQSASFLPDANQFVKNMARIKGHKVSEYMSKPPITIKKKMRHNNQLNPTSKKSKVLHRVILLN